MNDIALKACECLTTLSDELEQDDATMEIGLCLMDAAKPYQKQIKKDYDIDFINIDVQGEELGKIIGLEMASVCPRSLIKMANMVNNQKSVENSENVSTGEVTAISNDKFVELSIKNETGKISKYYWLTFIESNVELSNTYQTLKNKVVEVTYTTQEFFDARIGEYRSFKIIQKLDLIKK
jgi:predicted ATP-dependent protease